MTFSVDESSQVAVHVFRNTRSESIVICQIQIQLMPILCAVPSCWLNGVWGWEEGGEGIRLQLSFFCS